MKLIIVDDVTVEDIANILGMRKNDDKKETEPIPTTKIKIGDMVQIDDPTSGYHTGTIDEIKDGSVHLSGKGWFSGEFVTGKLS